MWLEAPLQSWGCDSKYNRRSTSQFPSKSGVLGIVLSAMGKGGEQRELLDKLSSTDLQVDCFAREFQLENSTLEDFHMVGSHYNESDPWENLLIPKNSEGKKAVGGGQKLTYRYYLQDMAYATYLQVPDEHINDVGDALIDPVWPIFLGRKCCIPSEIIFQGIYSNKAECIEKAKEIANEKSRKLTSSVLQENDIEKGDVIVLNDVPVQFGQRKIYKERYVTIVKNTDARDLS